MAWMGLSKIASEVKEYRIDWPIVDLSYLAISLSNYLVVPLKFCTWKSGTGNFVYPIEGSSKKYSKV